MRAPVRLFQGDNLEVLTALASQAALVGQVALAYLDPPFATGRDFGAYDDRWPEGVRGLVEMLVPRLRAIHRLLADDGSILVHVDPRSAPRVALALDEIFGEGDRAPSGGDRPGFRNELVWVYGLGGSSPRFWPRKHDTILWYSKGSRWWFVAPKVPARSARMRGQQKKQPDVLFGPRAAHDDDALRALGATDVLDVAAINNRAHERLGYPTQKPEALLRTLLEAHAPEGRWVIDPFCGSGTTLAVARALGRPSIGIDASDAAIATACARLDVTAEPTPPAPTAM